MSPGSTGLAATHSLLVPSPSQPINPQSFRSVTLSPLRVHMKAADVQNVFALNWLDWIFLGTFYIILRYCHFHSRMSSVLSPVKLTLSSQKTARSRIIGIPDSPILAAPFEQDPTFAGAMRRSVPLALCHVYMPSVAARRSSGCLVLLLAMETDRKLLKNMENTNFHQTQKSQIKIYQATGVEKRLEHIGTKSCLFSDRGTESRWTVTGHGGKVRKIVYIV